MRFGIVKKLAGVLAGICLFGSLPSTVLAQDDEYVRYRMAEGDTLIGLSNRYLRGDDAVARVALLNRIYNPRRIPVGTVIRLPRDLLAFRPAGLSVRHFTGNVTVNGQPAVQGTTLPEGARIATGAGSFVSFVSADGAAVSLPSNTNAVLLRSRIYTLGDLRDVEFRVQNGRGEVTAPTLREGERWRTSTPVAVTAVRGTEYRVGYLEEAGLGVTEVVEGTVAVGTDDTSAPINEGFGISASGSGLGELEALLPPAEIENPGAIQTGDVVAFEITPPAGASATRTTIARDAGFLEVVAEEVSAEDAAFTELGDGRYFVRSRGISTSGIEGLSETFTFRRKRLGSEASVEASPIDDGFRFAWLAQGEGTVHFAFQLWRQGEADAPLYDEIALPGTATVVTGLEEGTYVWRVAALQADPEDGLLKIWGPEQTLTVSAE